MASREPEFDERESITKNLKVVYEDPEIIVYTAPTEDELKEILLDLLRKHEKMSIRDLHQYLSGLASEDKIRYALSKLVKDNIVGVDKEGYYFISGVYEEDYGGEHIEHYYF